MARRYWVQTSDSKITGLSDIDAVAVPDGHDAVLETVIRAADPPGADGRIQAGGKWDGVNYTPPSGDGVLEVYSTTTDIGRLKNAALLAHNQLLGWRGALEAVAPFFPAQDVAVGHDFLSFGHRGVRGVMLSDHWTVAQRVKFAEEMATGALDVTGPAEFFEVIEEAREMGDSSAISAPTQRVVWVDPADGSRYNLAQSVGSTDTAVEPNMVAEVTDFTVYPTGGWISDITS